MPRERNRLLVAAFAKDGRGDITPKPMSQLHSHFPQQNTAPRRGPSFPRRELKMTPYVPPNVISPRFAAKKSFLTMCNELLQPRLEAELTKFNQLFQLLLKSCPIKALVMLKYLLFAPQIWCLLNCLGTSGIPVMLFPLGGAAAHTSGGKRSWFLPQPQFWLSKFQMKNLHY